jgi:dihydroorotate dehydrogenase (NAD+) catalytic subunit
VTTPLLIGQHGRNLSLRNPLIAGPGSAGYGRDTSKLLPLEKLGAIATTTTTAQARNGLRQPRLAETPAGMLLTTGLHNPGIRTVLHRHAAAWGRMHVPIILSIAGEDADSFAYCAQLAEETESLAAVLLQPDVLDAGSDIVRVVDTVRGLTSLPLIVRLTAGTPQRLANDVIDLSAVGCDAVVVGSDWPGLVLDRSTGKPLLIGSIAGPAIRPLALRQVYDVARLLGPEHLPLIAAGGVSSGADVSDFLAAGASAVLLDSVMLVDPAAVTAMVQAVSGR